ncbi:MAG: hypothetical protein AAF937_11710 [Planctomycetota bacterium]
MKSWSGRLIACGALFATSVSGAQPGTIVFVDDDAPLGGNGSSWASAYRFLQDALDPGDDAAETPAQIRIAGGTYLPDRSSASPGGTGDRTAAFVLVDGVSVLGGFAGLADPAKPDLRALDAFPTVLSGDLAQDDMNTDGDDVKGDNAYHVIESWGSSAETVVDGVTVTGGWADRDISDGWFPLRRDDSGGGAVLAGSDAVFRDVTFVGNHAQANASVLIDTGTGPFADAEAGGGAVLISQGAPRFERCMFVSNTANRTGGAVSVTRSAAVFEACSFFRNRVGLEGFFDISFGGALHDASADFFAGTGLLVSRGVFIGNRAAGDGPATGDGGAISYIFSLGQYRNCLILANDATGFGGGVFADNISDVRIANTAIVGNTSGSRAAGIYDFSEVADRCLVTNSIVWGNRSATPGTFVNEQMESQNANFDIRDTIIERFSEEPVAAFNVERVREDDPLFRDTLGPDGVVWTGDEDLRFGSNSPAVDSGNNALLTNNDSQDLLGQPRRLDDEFAPDIGLGVAPIVDLGPYERERCRADVNDDGRLTPADFNAWVLAFNNGAIEADQNLDTFVAPADFNAWVLNFNTGC